MIRSREQVGEQDEQVMSKIFSNRSPINHFIFKYLNYTVRKMSKISSIMNLIFKNIENKKVGKKEKKYEE